MRARRHCPPRRVPRWPPSSRGRFPATRPAAVPRGAGGLSRRRRVRERGKGVLLILPTGLGWFDTGYFMHDRMFHLVRGTGPHHNKHIERMRVAYKQDATRRHNHKNIIADHLRFSFKRLCLRSGYPPQSDLIPGLGLRYSFAAHILASL